MASASFSKCTEEVKQILDNEEFGAKDFWEGYKLYCFAHYSNCDTSKGHFEICKMGRVMCLLQNKTKVTWGAQFDEAIRQVWAMMEEYVYVMYSKDCTNLRSLMEEFEDVEELCKSKNGHSLVQLIEDDEHGTERLHRDSLVIQLDTNIFKDVRSRLNEAQTNLANLVPRPHLGRHR